MSETPLHFKTITELAELIKSKALSPVEVTAAMLDRIQAQDPHYKSYATVMAEQARESARAAERAVTAGNYLGLLHGIPIAVKDLCFTRGVATMGATKALSDHVPDFDSTVVQKLNAAGAIILGKLNLTEGAMAGYNRDFQVPVNPWGANLWSGASSSGSGVATAAGLCYGSLGSDTGGSIRFPSAACGVVGIKPTWGRVSRYGVLALAESLDHIGPMTRSAADAGAMLQAIAGPDSNDLTSLPVPAPDMLAGIDGGVRGVRIGLDEEYISGNTDPELAESVLAGIRVLEGLGAVIVPVKMPEVSGYMDAWGVLCAAEAAVAHEATYPSRRDDYGPWFQGWLDKGAAGNRGGVRQGQQRPLRLPGPSEQRVREHRRTRLPDHDHPSLPHHAGGNVRAPVLAGQPPLGPVHDTVRLHRRPHHILALWSERRRPAP